MGKAAPSVVIVAGPTASGKSALGLALAERFGGVVINADSMQVYRELRILTARPSAGDEARVPHRLYGILPATLACSAAMWRDLARTAIAEAGRAGQVPVLVGGSGLYLKALLEGLAPVPEVAAEVRAEARAILAERGTDGLRTILRELDPETAAALAAGDRQRLVRAFEVVRGTGVGLAAWRRAPDPHHQPVRACTIFLDPPRAALYQRIDQRFAGMIAAGALEEARALSSLGLSSEQPAMKAHGVPELLAHLRGACDLEQAVAQAQRNTRRYAKRQRTWFRHQMALDFVAQYSESSMPEIFSFVSDFLLTRPT